MVFEDEAQEVEFLLLVYLIVFVTLALRSVRCGRNHVA
jgi:hypothetical protein